MEIQKTEGHGNRSEPKREALLEALRGEKTDRPSEMDFRGASFAGEDLSGLDLSRLDFSGADLSGTDLSQSNLAMAKLCGTNFSKANMNGCELFAADLTGANLNECSALNAGFGAANLTDARLMGAKLKGATFSKSRACFADFRAADMEDARISEADLSGAVFTRANLQQADLKKSVLSKASFELADLRGARLLGIRNFEKASWLGADIRGIDLRGAYLVRSYIEDENYLFEFRSRGGYYKVLYWLWWVTSDCGRSIFRWTLWIFVVTFLFSIFYNLVGMDYGDNETFFSPFYYSVVTLTTLGYGDVFPASLGGQILAVVQALLGYVGLGGLLSILANKMARRAG